jgi:hypothetical protein
MVINFSRGLRDQMRCVAYDEESWRINRACLAEKCKNTGWKNCVDGTKSTMRQAVVESAVHRKQDDENCKTRDCLISGLWGGWRVDS